tara:strand:- start:1019 stop:1321 length:303 start_codon:yes stop_codon:yes gene_type:complete
MKLRLHWAQQYKVLREFPVFELDSEQFPELELEMLDVFSAKSSEEQTQALNGLEYKMQSTPASDRGETIFEMVGPYNSTDDSIVYPVTDEQGFFCVAKDN